MKLREIYSREINRTINPAVVVGNQADETIDVEIGEYVFTDDIINKLHKALKAIKENRLIDKTGIWINGYYGSGKSHFIKFLHYCISAKTSERAFGRLIEAVDSSKYDPYKSGNSEEITVSNLKLLQKWYNQNGIQDIMFNVEDETDDGSGERLTRIFLSMFNKFRGYNSNDIPLALLFEKYLDQKGKLQEFKIKLKEKHSYDWDENAADIASYELSTILDLGKELVPELDKQSLHTKLSDKETYRIKIEHLTKEINEFIKDKDPEYRLIFLVDEISQYIGRDQGLLLNLQEIVSKLSDVCKKQVWVACTAQQLIQEVASNSGVEEKSDDYGKILGRFETRISLDSTDPSYITQKRVLDKNSAGLKELARLYKDKQDAIENQFRINHELYKGFQTEKDFELSYPFVPYQFKLIAHVFDAFQNLQYVIKEVKDNERSVLGITHYTAKKNADKEVGTFIPFDAFFNEQFNTNLTQRGRRAIQNAIELPYVQKTEFAKRVVNALFMISNLPDAVKVTFKSNVDNLIVLMMTNVDENKLQLKNKIEEVLAKLVEESIIREEKGSYFFYNEDEIDVTNLVKNTTPNLDFKWDKLNDILSKMLDVRAKYRYHENDFSIKYNVDDKNIFRTGDFQVKLVIYDDKDVNQLSLNNGSNDLLICVNEWLKQNQQLKRDFEWYCKVDKYLFDNKEAATGSREKTLENFRSRNKALLDDVIKPMFEKKFSETRFVSGHTIYEASQIPGTTPKDRYKNALEKHIDGVYKYNGLAHGFPITAQDLRSEVKKGQTTTATLNEAEIMVDDHITNNGGEMTVEDIIAKFSDIPFGWKDTAIIYILVMLNKKKRRDFRYRMTPRFPISDFVEKAIVTSERKVCEVVPTEEISQEIIDNTIAVYRNIFNEDIARTADGNDLFISIIDRLKKEYQKYNNKKDEYHGKYPFGKHFDKLAGKIHDWTNIREPKRLFKSLEEEQSEVKVLVDDCKALISFTETAMRDYDGIIKFHQENKENFNSLEQTDIDKANQLGEFIKSDLPHKTMRIAVIQYRELKDGIKKLLEDLINRAKQEYNDIFDDLDKLAKENGITEPNVYGSRIFHLESIQKFKSITQARLKISEGNKFKNDQITIIIKHAAEKTKKATPTSGTSGSGSGSTSTGTKPQPAVPQVGEPIEIYVTRKTSVIKTEQEMDKYLDNLRSEMSEALKNHKTIILK